MNNKIIYRLINIEKNQEQLKNIPYIHCEDMAVIFGEVISFKEKQLEFKVIDCEEQERLRLSNKDLWLIASELTPQLFPATIVSFKELGLQAGEHPVFRLSNESQIYGATAMVYDGVLEDFARQYKMNLYVLPLSIHECLILFDDGGFTIDELREMIRTSNRTIVDEGEYLSDNVYYYNLETKDLYGLL